MGVFTAAPHHDVLALLLQIAVLLLAARGLGEVARRCGQPAVVGEILAGMVLGPSLLSGLVPILGEWIVPQSPTQGYLLETISMIGAIFLLLVTGLETDLQLIRRRARTAIGVSAGGITVTFASGFVLGQLLPDWTLANPAQRLVFALFLATAMSISAIPVIAKVLIDLKLMRRDIGQTIIASGMIDDTVGWTLLSIVAGLAAGEAVTAATVLQTAGRVFLFILLSFTVGRWLVKRALDFVQDEVISPDRLLSLVVLMTFAWSAVTQALKLEPVLGAFVMGVLFGQMPRLPADVRRTLESVALAIFAPVFFAVAGLKVDLASLTDPRLLAIALLVIAVATAGKVTGTYAGARMVGRCEHWTALSFGAGLNARGAMEIIVATIGLSLGILSQEMFSIIVLMAMATSLMAPPALRWVLARVRPEEEELKRLEQEERAAGSRVASIHRVLVPVRLRAVVSDGVQPIQAEILRRMALKTDLSVTLLSVAEPNRKAETVQFLDRLAGLFSAGELVKKAVEGERAGEVILDEAQKHYDLLVLGASEGSPGVLFNSLVDELVRLSPCLTLVVKGVRRTDGWSPRRILVPTNGTAAAQIAAEVAFALASPQDQVTVLNVVVDNGDSYAPVGSDAMVHSRLGAGYQIVRELRRHGESLDLDVRAEVLLGREPESVILDFARDNEIDLMVLGTAVRAGTGRLFLGTRVERLLAESRCPVVVVNSA